MYDYDPELQAKCKLIAERWQDFSSKDIELFRELPEWRVIVEDIQFLLSAAEEVEKAYSTGYTDGKEDGYEDGYNAGLDDCEDN